MAFAADISITRDPVYTGREGRVTEPFDTSRAARDYVNDLRNPVIDPFLSRAWEDIKISQNRNPDGTFARGFTVTVDYRAPGPGDDSTEVNVDPGDDGGAEL